MPRIHLEREARSKRARDTLVVSTGESHPRAARQRPRREAALAVHTDRYSDGDDYEMPLDYFDYAAEDSALEHTDGTEARVAANNSAAGTVLQQTQNQRRDNEAANYEVWREQSSAVRCTHAFACETARRRLHTKDARLDFLQLIQWLSVSDVAQRPVTVVTQSQRCPSFTLHCTSKQSFECPSSSATGDLLWK